MHIKARAYKCKKNKTTANMSSSDETQAKLAAQKKEYDALEKKLAQYEEKLKASQSKLKDTGRELATAVSGPRGRHEYDRVPDVDPSKYALGGYFEHEFPEAKDPAKLIFELKEVEPALVRDRIMQGVSAGNTFAYDATKTDMNYMQQLEQYLLQTLDVSKKFDTPLRHQRAVILPNFAEMSRSVDPGPNPNMRPVQNMRTYNALLRLILCGHEPEHIVETVDGKLADTFTYKILRSFKIGQVDIGKYHFCMVISQPAAEARHKLGAAMLMIATEAKEIVAEISYPGYGSVFENYEPYLADASKRADILKPATKFESYSAVRLDQIIPWLLRFAFEGELPGYKSHGQTKAWARTRGTFN